jgi:hypothetical protein
MKRLRTILGYLWATLTIPLIAVGMSSISFFEGQLGQLGLHVSARWSGGEVVQTIEHDSYHTLIHRPVFDGLFWQNPEGFVQIDWRSDRELPARIDETVDFDRDGREDFQVQLDTRGNTAQLIRYDQRVLSLVWGDVLVFENGRTVRVEVLAGPAAPGGAP